MRNPDTYKGFVYQKKCAFLLLLNELVDETGVIAFRMEHPKGDDFDLIYNDKLRIFQTKDVARPDMPDFLIKMWRRYTENMLPEENRGIALGFIFSKDHHDDACFSSLAKGKMCPELMIIKDEKDKDGKIIVKISNDADWENFLAPITVEVRPTSQIETELNRAIGFMFIAYGLPKTDRSSILFEFLGRLDEIMVSGAEVKQKEIREIIGAWFTRYSLEHPLIKPALVSAVQHRLAEIALYQPPEPSFTGPETL